jgi:nucleoid-associated protein YgaU
MAEKTDAAKTVDPNTLKSNEIARSVMGTGIKPSGFNVQFQNGIATVRGTVASEADHRSVLVAVRAIAGVREVKDEIQVGGTAGAPGATSLGGKSYTVKKGDTLSEIAKAHYGKATDFNRIFEANRDVLSDPDEIQVGQVLKLP